MSAQISGTRLAAYTKRGRQQVPAELGRGVVGGDELLDPCHRVGDLVGFGQAALARILPGLVLERGRVDDQGALLSEEAAAGLLTQVALGHHIEDPLGQPPLLAHLVVDGGLVVAGDGVREHVGAGQVGGAVGGRDRTGQGPAAGRVDLLDGEAVLVHGVDGVDRGEDAYAVGHEVGCVLAQHHALAQAQLGELFEALHHRGVGALAGDQLQQIHVARGEEEMGAQEAALDVVGQYRSHGVDRQPRGVGRHDGLGTDVFGHPGEQVLLDVQALHHSFHYPVDAGQLRKIVFEVARGQESGAAGMSERGRPAFGGRRDAGDGQAVPHCWMIQTEALLLLFVVQLGRCHIEQERRYAGVGQMSRHGSSHAPRSQNGRLSDHKHASRPPQTLRGLCPDPGR